MLLNSPSADAAEIRIFKTFQQFEPLNSLNGAKRLNKTKRRNDLNGEPKRSQGNVKAKKLETRNPKRATVESRVSREIARALTLITPLFDHWDLFRISSFGFWILIR